jgi:hypothetical protein
VAKLEVAMAPKDADTRPLVIRKDDVHYLTVLPSGKVGIGKAEPEASLDVKGEIRANFFKAGEGYSRRLPVGKVAVGRPTEAGTTEWDEDIYWYRIAKIAAPQPLTLAGAEFSLRSTVAGRAFHGVTFRVTGVSGLTALAKRPFARLTTLTNTGLLRGSFSKARIVMPTKVEHACEGYLEILTRQLQDAETDVNFSIYDNLNAPAWQPVPWEKQSTILAATFVACEYSLENRLFLVADATERLAVDSNGAVLINGKVGIGTPSPKNQLHVGSGSSSIKDDRVNLVVASESQDAGIAIAQRSGVNVLLQASEAGGYLGTSSNHPLVLRTSDDDRIVITANGHVDLRGSLAVQGNISEQLDVIETMGRKDWTAANHPIMNYFSRRLTGKPPGTMLRAITDYWEWKGHYWNGWVDADGKIRVIHNYHNTTHIAPPD